MTGGPAGKSEESINPRSRTQLLLTQQASSVNLDRLDVPSRADSYPQFPTAATSLASLNTLPEPEQSEGSRALTFASLPDPRDDAQSTASTSIPSGADAETLYRFLTNGARAVGAFARPWPIAVVGVPTNIQFNIARAEFKLTVKVTADDMQRSILSSPTSASSSSRRESSDSSEKEECAATEIFIPLIHFAADPLARRAPTSVYSNHSSSGARPSDATALSTTPLRQYTSSPTLSSPPRLPEQPTFEDLTFGENSRNSALTSSTNTGRSLRPNGGVLQPTTLPVASSLSSSTPTQTVQTDDMVAQGRGDSLCPAWTTWSGYEVPLALEISASEGSRWEVDGQVLRWWYPGPLSNRNDNGEVQSQEKTAPDGSVERFIHIKRKGGAIKGIGTKDIRVEKEASSIWDLCPWS